MKKIISKWGWLSISKFGKETDDKAWLLIQHADQDIAFQLNVLKLLQKALKNNDTDPKHFAYLWDRVQRNTQKPQRYSTQGLCIGANHWVPAKMENPAQVDQLRQSIGLEPMKNYTKVVSQFCP